MDNQAQPPTTRSRIPATDRSHDLPLSFNEELTWARAQAFPAFRSLSTCVANLLIGPLDAVALSAAISDLSLRHEILRTSFVVRGERPIREIGAHPATLEIVDLQNHPEAARDAEASRLTLAEAQAEFTMTAAMFRAKLFVLGQGRHVLILTLHHAISDAWSLGLIAQDLKALYRSKTLGGSEPLTPLRIQYADYAAWSHARLSLERRHDAVEQSRQRLTEPPAPLSLPTHAPLAGSGDTSTSTTFALSGELMKAVKATSRRCHVTPFITLLSGFTAVLSRLTGQADMMVVVPVSDRAPGDLQQMIGSFVDIVPVRVGCIGNPTFAQYVERTKEACRVLYSDERVPLLVLSRDLGADFVRKALGQVVFNVVNWSDPRLDLAGVSVEEWPTGFQTPVRSALTLNIRVHADVERAEGILKYRRDQFLPGWIERLAEQICDLLAQVAADPTKPLDEYRFDASLKNLSA